MQYPGMVGRRCSQLVAGCSTRRHGQHSHPGPGLGMHGILARHDNTIIINRGLVPRPVRTAPRINHSYLFVVVHERFYRTKVENCQRPNKISIRLALEGLP